MRTLKQIDADMKVLQEERKTILKNSKVILWANGDIESIEQPAFFERSSKQGNTFSTREAAERERDRRALIQEIREASGFYKTVWDGETDNFRIVKFAGVFLAGVFLAGVFLAGGGGEMCTLGTIYIANNLEDANRIIEQFRGRLHLLED